MHPLRLPNILQHRGKCLNPPQYTGPFGNQCRARSVCPLGPTFVRVSRHHILLWRARHRDKGLASGELQFLALLLYLAMVQIVPIVPLVKLLYPKYHNHQELPSFSKEDGKRQKYLFEKARRKGTLEGRHQSTAAIGPQKDKSSVSKADPHAIVQGVISRHLLLNHSCTAPATGMRTRVCIFQHYSPKSQAGVTTRSTNEE